MALSVQQIAGFPTSARAYKWDVNFQIGLNEIAGLRCTTSDLPQPDFNVIKTNFRNGFTLPESGAVTWNDLNFTVVEVDSWEILQQLWELGNKQFNYETGEQQADDLGNITITMNSVDNNPAKSFTLNNCIISNFSPDQLTSDPGSVVNISFTVAYLYATLN